jgi:hypothetical protein
VDIRLLDTRTEMGQAAGEHAVKVTWSSATECGGQESLMPQGLQSATMRRRYPRTANHHL